VTLALHVAAMAFPTHQGTQAVVRAMLDVLAATGVDAHLLAYGESEYAIEPRWTLHRIAARPRLGSFRSGPSLRKVALDLRLAGGLRRLAGRLRPDVVVAHHVEAAAAAVAAGVRPLVFFAHTALGPELPTYARPLLGGVLAGAGERLDGVLCRRAGAVAAISPALADLLAGQTGADVRYVAPPWPLPSPIAEGERAEARRALELAPGDEVVLYAGNLDRYQGWELLLPAIARLASRRPAVRLLVATGSAADPVRDAARAAGIGARLRVEPLGGEETRRRVHSAADVAVVPRRSPGGLPIKLLDALARGVPCVAASRAAAGLDLRGAALLVADDDGEAIATGLGVALGGGEATRELGRLGRANLPTHNPPARLLELLEPVVARAAERTP
jgi:glycosyltransferase involved in cell wall biosynthesis